MNRYIKCNDCGNIDKYTNNVLECNLCSSNNIKEFNSDYKLEESSFINKESLAYYPNLKDKPINKFGSKPKLLINFIYDDHDSLYNTFITDVGEKEDYRSNYGINVEEVDSVLNIKPELIDVTYNSKLRDINPEFKVESYILDYNKKSIKEEFSNISNKLIESNSITFDSNKNYNKLKEFIITRTILSICESLGSSLIEGNPNKYLVGIDYLTNSPLLEEFKIKDNLISNHPSYVINSHIETEGIHIVKQMEKVIEDKQLKNLLNVIQYFKNNEDYLNYGNYSFTKLLWNPYFNKESMINITINSLLIFSLSKLIGFNNMKLLIMLDGDGSFDNVSDFRLIPFYLNSDNDVTAIDITQESCILIFETPMEFINTMSKKFSKEFVITIDDLPDNFYRISNNEFDSEDSKEILTYILSDSKPKPFSESIMLTEDTDLIKKKRENIEKLIYKVFSTLDTTGLNTSKYKNKYSKLSDEKFFKEMRDLVNNKDNNFYLEILPNKNEPNLRDIKAALKVLNIPENEYVYYRHDGSKDNPIRTRYKVPVG